MQSMHSLQYLRFTDDAHTLAFRLSRRCYNRWFRHLLKTCQKPPSVEPKLMRRVVLHYGHCESNVPRCLLLVGWRPFLWWEGIVRGCWTVANVSNESGWEHVWLIGVEDTEHIRHELADLLLFSLLAVVGMLQCGDHVHDLLQSGIELLLGPLQLADQIVDVARGALRVGAVLRLLQNLVGLSLGHDEVLGGGGSHGGCAVHRGRWDGEGVCGRCQKEEEGGESGHGGMLLSCF
mmetsp:Transcript_6791/g.18462  ORF Transcript_6791/g.18462 Transcript_6791/m.18462 type:complete len:234 (+) Transcript_6791:197-898(+)